MKTLYLVDTSSLFFRAFYAVRPLTSPEGQPVNAVYGFISMIVKLLAENKPDYLAFCLDRPEPSFRKDLDVNYKANRSEMPEDLVPQMPYIRKVAEWLGLQCLDRLGFEADDLIGTLAKWGEAQGLKVFIVSGDKDFAQLVNSSICLVDTMKDEVLGVDQVFAKWGVRPDQMIDYLALVGDSSDNIPGVLGIGPKGAVKLLSQWQNLDSIYQNAAMIAGKIGENLLADKSNAYLSQKLVTIVCDVPLPSDLADYEIKNVSAEVLQNEITKLNFKSILPRLKQLPHVRSQPGSQNQTQSELGGILSTELNSTNSSQPIREWTLPESVDLSTLEFKSLYSDSNRIRLWIFKLSSGLFLVDESENKIYRATGELSDWRETLDNPSFSFKGFDLKNVFHLLDLRHASIDWDTMLAAYVLAPGEDMDFNQVLAPYLGRAISDEMDPRAFISDHIWAAEKIKLQIEKVQSLDLLQKIEIPTCEVLYDLEKRGFKVDRDILAVQSKDLEKDLEQIQTDVFAIVGKEFNLLSPKQLSLVLFDQLKLPPSKKTKTGFSTDNEVLEKLKGMHPIIEKLISFREFSKLKSTYVDALPTMIAADGRIHTTFHQALTSTGRLSSIEPNLQNIPIRTPRGGLIRKAFVAEKGNSLLSADYSQIELRVLAHYSKDKGLISAFADDLDIHQATAAEVFSIPLKSVTAEHRRAAKAVNFGIAYGQGAFGLAENLGISRSEAQEIINNYFKKFGGVQDYIQATIESAKQKGFVETLSGRRRYLKEINSSNVMVRKSGERAAINAPIQGTAADIVKIAMVNLAHLNLQSKMILQVHDELLFEAEATVLESDSKAIRQKMENAFELNVPLKVNVAIGLNWADAH